MPETFPITQWGNDVDEKSQRWTPTRAFQSNDIVRWRESIPKETLGLFLQSAGTRFLNSSEQITTYDVPTEVRVPRAKKGALTVKGNYVLLKKYDGFVLSRSKDSFTARLFEAPGDYPVLEAEFELEELSEADRQLVTEGAALVWTIGYHDDGSRKRESLIYMRRRPGWDKKEIDQAKKETEALIRDIQWK
jgi:hypothetical protein